MKNIPGLMRFLYVVALASFPLTNACLAASVPSLPDLAIPQSFGISAHFKDQEIGSNVAYLQKAGFGWVRRDLFWSEVEKKSGIYDFSTYDTMVDALSAAGIRCLLILDYGNPLYDKGLSPASLAAQAAFARFAAAAASHYAGKGVVWEMYNEPNVDIFWKPKPDVDAYISMADAATDAIRQADPGAVIVGPAVSGPYPNEPTDGKVYSFLQQVLKSNVAHKWNAITVHPYRPTSAPPETIAPQMEEIRGMMRDQGIDPTVVPLVASEWGYSTWQRGIDEDKQAAYAVRELLWASIEFMPLTIWYDWQDDGPDDSNNEYRYGLLRAGANRKSDGNEKPSFVAIKQMAQLLNGYRFASLVQNDNEVVVARFIRDGHAAYALWSKNNATNKVGVPLTPGMWNAAAILGDEKSVAISSNGVASINATTMPLIIWQKGARRGD